MHQRKWKRSSLQYRFLQNETSLVQFLGICTGNLRENPLILDLNSRERQVWGQRWVSRTLIRELTAMVVDTPSTQLPPVQRNLSHIVKVSGRHVVITPASSRLSYPPPRMCYSSIVALPSRFIHWLCLTLGLLRIAARIDFVEYQLDRRVRLKRHEDITRSQICGMLNILKFSFAWGN